MRLFIAIFPPKEYIRYFADVYRVFDKQKRNLKPIPVDQVHLTLKFIGASVTPESKEMILNELKKHEGRYPKPKLKISKIQFGFERQTDPRNLLADIESNRDLIDLANIVHDKVKILKQRDTIRWKPKFSTDFHITIARFKESATRSSGKEVKKLLENVKIPAPDAFQPEEIVVMESILTNTGPVYKKLETIKL